MPKYASKKRSAIALQSVESVNYSVALRPNPMNQNDPEKAYANLQFAAQVVRLEQLAQHILEHGSPYTRDMIIGVATALVDCTREYVTRGFKVQLGDLGTFKLSIAQRGAKTLELFTADNISDAWVEYEPGGYFVDLRGEINFNKVATRNVQKAAERLYKSGRITSEQWKDILEGRLDLEVVAPGGTEPEPTSPGGGGDDDGDDNGDGSEG